MTDGLSWWYADAGMPGYPTRAQLDEGKRALYEARETLVDAMNGRKLLTNITADVLAIFAQAPIDTSIERGQGPDEYAAEHGDELARLEQAFGKALDAKLAGSGEALYRRLFGITGGWAPERRADLLVRYLGFPYWDVLLYPIQAVADAGERDAIEVVRMSPRDTKLLPPLDPHKPKLAGFGKMHFGAFFDRAGRENDYLWGRLDGAERLIGLVLGDVVHRRGARGLVPEGVRRDRRGGGRRAGEGQAAPRPRAQLRRLLVNDDCVEVAVLGWSEHLRRLGSLRPGQHQRPSDRTM